MGLSSEVLFGIDRQCLCVETDVPEMLVTVAVMVMGHNIRSFFVSFMWFAYCKAIWRTEISSKNSLLLDKLMVTQPREAVLHFLWNTEGSLPCPHESATYPNMSDTPSQFYPLYTLIPHF